MTVPYLSPELIFCFLAKYAMTLFWIGGGSVKENDRPVRLNCQLARSRFRSASIEECFSVCSLRNQIVVKCYLVNLGPVMSNTSAAGVFRGFRDLRARVLLELRRPFGRKFLLTAQQLH